MQLIIHSDGGSLANPGKAAVGFTIHTETGELLHSHGEYIGIASNNVAEYTGLLRALTYVRDHRETFKQLESISCVADSELMVKQLNGLYKIKHPDMRRLHAEVSHIVEHLRVPITFRHVLREENHTADGLVKKALGR